MSSALLPACEQGHASLVKGEWRSDSPYQNFSRGHISCPVQSAITRSAAEKAVLSARPHAFRATSGSTRGYTVAFPDFCHPPVRSNQPSLKSRKSNKTHIHHSPWILTPIRLIPWILTPTRLTPRILTPIRLTPTRATST